MQKSKESNGNVQKTVYHGRGNATKSHKNKASSFSSRSVTWASEIFQAICIMVAGFPRKYIIICMEKGSTCTQGETTGGLKKKKKRFFLRYYTVYS